MIAETIGLGIISTFFSFYLKEQKEVDKCRDSINIRIHVNGIRGKTSVTRMIGSILRPHYLTVTKTTGSEPKIIRADGSETLIKRSGAANIKEQVDVLKLAHNENAEAIVFECMAIEPDLQRTLEEKVMKSTIGVITNIRYDHEEVMGETLESIARSLSNTIPYNSHLVVTKDIQCLNILEEVAKKRNTIVHYADVRDVPMGYAQKFDFMNFDENITIALKVAELVGINREDALKDMLNTKHDVGKGALYTRMVENENGGRYIHFLNSFANNDVQSVIIMLSQVEFKKRAKKIALLSHRDDRVRRTMGVIKFVCEYGFDSIVISSGSDLIEKELRYGGYKGDIITTTDGFVEKLDKLSTGKDNYWIGLANIKTQFAESVLSYFGAM